MFLPSAVAQKRTAELGKCKRPILWDWDDFRNCYIFEYGQKRTIKTAESGRSI